MQTHIYATFVDPESAEKAAGALLDKGVRSEDLTVIQHRGEDAVVETVGFADDPVLVATSPTNEVYVSSAVQPIVGVGDPLNVVEDPLLVTDPNMAVYAKPPMEPFTGIADPSIPADDWQPSNVDTGHVEEDAKHGISTTTSGDVGVGAIKGTGWGLGLGAIAAMTALFIPGVGLVVGGGALAMAIAAAAAATGAGAVAGAVTGYLVDQGFEERDALQYHEFVNHGGAILTLSLPSGNVEEVDAWEVIEKYNGTPFRQTAVAMTDAYLK